MAGDAVSRRARRGHGRVREATLLAAAAAGVETVHQSGLSQSVMRRRSEHVRVDDPGKADVREEPLPGAPDTEIDTVVDVREHRAEPAPAMSAHASQASSYDGPADELRDAFPEVAHVRRVAPPRDGRTLEDDLSRATVGSVHGRNPVSRTTRPTTPSPWARHRHGGRCWWDHQQARWVCRPSDAETPAIS